MIKKIKIILMTQGLETADFAIMLLSMYRKWANKHGYKISEDDEYDIIIEGDNLNGLDQEHGIHRLCRISPNDDRYRRHTTFCKVIVDDMEISEKWADSIRTYMLNPVRYVKNLKNGVVMNDPEMIFDGNFDSIWNNTK